MKLYLLLILLALLPALVSLDRTTSESAAPALATPADLSRPESTPTPPPSESAESSTVTPRKEKSAARICAQHALWFM